MVGEEREAAIGGEREARLGERGRQERTGERRLGFHRGGSFLYQAVKKLNGRDSLVARSTGP
jgi:hypothetical protein